MTMSVAASHIPTDMPEEPFGQAGIFRYAGRIFAWLCLTVGLCAAAMSHRSGRFSDELTWSGKGQRLEIVSAGGQIAMVGTALQNMTSEGTGWSVSGGYGGYSRRHAVLRRSWGSDLGNTLGFEASLSSPYTNADGGFYLRAQWASVAVLFLLWPLVYGVRKIVRLVRPRAD